MIMNKTVKTVLLSFMLTAFFSACSVEFWHPDYVPSANADTTKTPVASDFYITGLSQVWDGSPKTVSITPKAGKSPGAITIYYNGSTTAPSAVGFYAITFNVAAAPDWKAASGLSAGTLVIITAPDLIRIEGGTFTMGSPSNEPGRDNDEVQHQVTLSAFYMGKYQITQAEYQYVMETNPSSFKGSTLPVEGVSWYDVAEYCNRLSQREGLTPAYTINGTNVTCNWNANGYRLPTEAEWEYACRAGTTTPFSTGNNITSDQANYDGNYPYNNNATGIYRKRTTVVGSFAPNPWGLYDMHGNVWEWCWDWYGSYSSGAQTNPSGPVSGDDRVIRGGSWSDGGQDLRSSFRIGNGQSSRSSDVGFRMARN
jgi:formylglycine-generating enzyme required for sulfatase activity